MTYNPENATEKPMLPNDTIFDGIIINIEDGTVSQFVEDMSKWSCPPTQPAIRTTTQVMYEGHNFEVTTIFTYENVDGKTSYSTNSKLGKFKKKYTNLPAVGTRVKVMTNDNGYGLIKLN